MYSILLRCSLLCRADERGVAWLSLGRSFILPCLALLSLSLCVLLFLGPGSSSPRLPPSTPATRFVGRASAKRQYASWREDITVRFIIHLRARPSVGGGGGGPSPVFSSTHGHGQSPLACVCVCHRRHRRRGCRVSLDGTGGRVSLAAWNVAWVVFWKLFL